MNPSPLVSVIIPVHNGEAYLDLCMETVLAQTYGNLEIWLVDDGSTDGSPAMCDGFAARDPRVHVIHKLCGGASSARNAALDKMSGEYVTFVDCDDFLLPHMVEFLLEMAEKYGCDIVTARSVDTAERRVAEVEQEPLRVEILTPMEALHDRKRFAVTVMHKLYLSRIFDRLRFPEGMIYEDLALLAPLLWNSARIAVTNQKVYFYYLSPNSVMRSGFSLKRLDMMKVYELNRTFYRNHGRLDLDEENSAEYYFRIARLWYDMVKANWPERKKVLPQLRAKEKELRPEVRNNPHFPLKMRLQRIAYRFFPRLTALYFRCR